MLAQQNRSNGALLGRLQRLCLVSSATDCVGLHPTDTELAPRAAQAAYLVEEDPAQPGFWARVAARVPGKSAADCFNRLYDGAGVGAQHILKQGCRARHAAAAPACAHHRLGCAAHGGMCI